jgi:hypothetical protein
MTRTVYYPLLTIHMRPSTPSIDYHICFPWVVVDSRIIILDKLQISLLPKVKVRLCEDIPQTLVICIEFTSFFHKVVPSNLESMNHSG